MGQAQPAQIGLDREHANPDGTILAWGMDGWALHPDLSPNDQDFLFHKRVRGFSG